MLRKSPINHLVAAAVVLVAWAFGVIWGASYLGDAISFQKVAAQDFQWTYRVVLSGLALQTLLVMSLWFIHGARDSTSTQVVRAKRIWTAYWLLEFVLSIVGVVIIAILYIGELLEPTHYAVIFLTTAMETWGAFWLATAVASPPIVEFVPWGKR